MESTGIVVLVAGITVGVCACSKPVDPSDADLILTNGKIYTLNWSDPALDGTPAPDAPFHDGAWHPDAEALAIAGDRIVFVGNEKDASRYRGDATRVIDLAGAVVVPGLVDAHVHIAELGKAQRQIDLTDVQTEAEAIERVVTVAATAPKGQWLAGRGWDEGAWADRYPTLSALSAAVPDHPVVLDSLHGFAVWGNRLALQHAGIDRDTVAPAGGRILRDNAGDPTGVLLNRATALLRDAVPAPTDAEFLDYVRTGLQAMARDGYVAVHEAGAGADHMRAFDTLQANAALPVRVYAMLSAREPGLCRDWLRRGPVSGRDGMLAVRAVKAYYDGALGSRGARLFDDYSDLPGHRGVSGDGYGFDATIVEQMMAAGFQAGIHAIGDAGNHETLDFIEAVQTAHPDSRDQRHRIEHAQVLSPPDIPRLAAGGIIASMQPPHAVEDMPWAEDRLGPERIRGAYAWRSLRVSGAHLVFSSDLTGSDHDIFYGLHAAVTRRDKKRQPRQGWYPREAVTAEEALRGYTSWAAYSAHWEADTGTLAPGKWADITIMDIDILNLGLREPGRLLEGSVLMTVVAGKVVKMGSE